MSDAIAGWQDAMVRAVKAVDPVVTLVPNHESSQWLRDRFRAGPTSWCPHIPLPLNPSSTPALLVLAEGGHLTCGGCAVGLRPAGSVAERTCARCGLICSDRPDERIRTVGLFVGLVTVGFGLCPACAAREFPQ